MTSSLIGIDINNQFNLYKIWETPTAFKIQIPLSLSYPRSEE